MKYLSAQKQGSLYAISSGLCYGLVGYFGMSLLHADLTIPTMLFWRFFVAALFVGLLLIPQYKIVKNLDRQTFFAFLYGFLFYGLSTIAYFSASLYVGTGLAMVIFFTFPAMVMAINALIYNATIEKHYYFAFGIIFIGMTFLVNPETISFDLNGIFLGIVCALLYACYICASKRISVPPLVSTLMVSLGCMTTSLFVALSEHSLHIPQSLSIWIDILCMGIICTAVPILLLLQCFKHISSEKASMLSVLEPVFVVLFGVILLDEQIAVGELIGVVVILSGALITLLSTKETIKKSAPYPSR